MPCHATICGEMISVYRILQPSLLNVRFGMLFDMFGTGYEFVTMILSELGTFH
jgi:hypothetical protein